MKNLIPQALILIAIALSAIAAPQPNFVILIGDDHGVYHSSVYGSPEFQTPNMQALADDGIHFTNAYVASPACGPSRAALFTGLMPYNNGIVGNHEIGLKPGVKPLLPNLLAQGYEVAFNGKVAHGGFAHHKDYVPEEVTIIERDPRPSVALANVAQFLKNRPDPSRPLALFIGATDTHTPWPSIKKARINPDDVVIPQRIYETPETRVEMARYVEAAENIDRKLGTIRRFVDKFLDPNNTLVAYTSDHGMPWPFGKWSLYENGIRTPFIASFPGTIPAGTTSDAMVSWIDLIPTLLDFAGADAPENIDGRSFVKVLTGEKKEHRDLIFAVHKGDKDFNVYPIRSVRKGNWKYLLNLHPEFQYTTHTDLLSEDGKGDRGHGGYHWPSYLEAAKIDPAAAAFLTDYYSSPAEELYDLTADPFEQNNLAQSPEHAEKLSELRDLVARRMIEVKDDKSLSGEPRLLKDHPNPTAENTETPEGAKTSKVYQEQDGTVIMEAENTRSPLGKWQPRTNLKPFTGESYLEFMGNNPGVGPPHSPLQFTFQINTPGDYWLSIRSHKRLTGDDGVTARSDMCNDCYVRMEGDFTSGAANLPLDWLTKDMKFWGNAAELDWKNWSHKLVGEHEKIVDARYRFQTGQTYTLTVSGRAQRFSIDRIVLTNDPAQRFNTEAKESPTAVTP